MPDIPRDLFGKGAVKYLRKDTGYIVYSVAEDGEDNGGTPRDNGSAEGSDLAFRVLQ